MVGRPQRKVFCQGFTRAGRRIGKLIPCRMKGYQLANGTFYCKYHGYQNVKGFKKANYTDETRIKQLSKLIQFKNYTYEQLKTITKKKSDLPLLTEQSLLTIEEKLVNGMSLGEILEDKQYPFSLMKFYGYLKKIPN